jgi:hypothetical protein
LFASTFQVNAQLKVYNNGNAKIGTGTGTIDATLNLYSSGDCSFFSRAHNLPVGGDAVKSTVYSASANSFAGWNNNTKTFAVKGDGTVWSRLNAYTSDSTLKENFGKIEKPEERLLKLNGLRYNFKSAKNKTRKNYGFIAQDVEKIFPNIVYENDQGIKGIALAELIPVIVEVLKKQQTNINELTKRVEALEGNGNAIEKSASIETGSTITNEVAESCILEQNIPNPFSENTRIDMYLPESVSNAAMYIYNMQGKQIKVFKIQERGNSSITIIGYTLEAGMYLYTLIADGKEVDTKKMILTK